MKRTEVFALAFLAVGLRFKGARRQELWAELYDTFHANKRRGIQHKQQMSQIEQQDNSQQAPDSP